MSINAILWFLVGYGSASVCASLLIGALLGYVTKNEHHDWDEAGDRDAR